MTAAAERAELRRLAEQATPLWSARERGHGVLREFEVIQAGGGCLFRSTSYRNMQADAEFIGAAYPRAVIGLLDRIERLERALGFYAEERHWFQYEETVNLQQTTAVFKTDKPEELPTDWKVQRHECSARMKMDQGKRAREALGELEGEFGQ